MDGDYIGRSLRRLEDFRFLTGSGRYVEDFSPSGQLRAVVVRSPHAHALIDGIDTAAARAMPGVRGVFTAADLDADGIGTLPCIAQVATVAPMIVPPRPALASRPGAACRRSGRVRRRRHQRAGARRGRANRGRVPSAALRRRCGGGARPRRAAAVGRGARQSVLPLRARRQRGGREGVCRRRRTVSRSRWSTTVSSSCRSSRAPRSAATTPPRTRSTCC